MIETVREMRVTVIARMTGLLRILILKKIITKKESEICHLCQKVGRKMKVLIPLSVISPRGLGSAVRQS